MKRPFNNQQYGTIQKLGMPKISQEIVDKAKLVFQRKKLLGDETVLELGITEGQQQVIQWLQQQVYTESTITGNPDELKE